MIPCWFIRWSHGAAVCRPYKDFLADGLIIISLLANTCIETTARFAAELGYHVTLVRGATTAFSAEAMHAAHDINAPNFAHAIVTAAELVATLAVAKGA